MTARLTRSAVLMMLLVLMLSAVAGCSRPGRAARRRSVTATAAVPLPQPVPVPTDLVRWDAAVRAAVEFELRRCHWDWQAPLGVYVGAQRAYASPGYGLQIAAAADPTSWQQEVVTERQVVTCTVTAPARVPNAPSTAARVYVRMTAASHVISTLGSFDAGPRTASWVVQLLGGRWLVSGPFEGG